TRIHFPVHPALRLRLRAGLNSFALRGSILHNPFTVPTPTSNMRIPKVHASPCETNLTFRHENARSFPRSVVYRLTRLSFSVRVTERHSYWRPAMEQPSCFPTVEFDRSKLMIRIEVTLNADPTAIGPVVEG